MTDPFHPYASLYATPKGPGDARPTALQIIRDDGLLNRWTGKVVLVTGATSGLGLEVARALYTTGADVFITARDIRKAEDVFEDIRKSDHGNGKLEVIAVDMNSLESVKKAAKDFLARSDRLNVLVNNAGIMAIPTATTTADGFEQQFGVNHLAHFTLTALLLPILLRSSTPAFNSRVIAVTSSAHRYSTIRFADVNLASSYDPWLAYGQSKTANIWMATHIDRIYGPRGVHAVAVHPGGALTALHQNVPAEMIAAWGADPNMMASMMAPDQGAATTTWAAVAGVWEGKGGKYLSECGVGGPAKDLGSVLDPGYGPYAFDREGEERLWDVSCEMARVEVEG
ncbi:putative short-chain dehydrogenase [Mytilinidion resinicola]|uniref:Short-chain dehydrogenase n=1 Tax=Mytilinidion resinicola TaxID=574789 RepID=A0A6A6Y237_9PEZI|nr:putative short-chain dehydrogenase [Mytilinidion resinicola]KAF2802285.1 putative short-chain dehydrogenase [Mytilinidion resinicola]